MGLNQEAMADEMKVQRSTYGRFERGDTSLFAPTMRKFLKFSGRTPEDIFTPEQDEFDGYLAEGTLSDRIDELSEEVRNLRKIVEMLAGQIEKLSAKK
ncbi:MAG: helix-turn-helix transcriptional regulator [Bacteroidales bacterium]|nr:helix-turn-helix transcriptional regulator [Bacteroidales bacterium]